MHTHPPPRLSDLAPVAVAADLLSEFGGGCCPSVTALLERLIDRQAADPRGGRP